MGENYYDAMARAEDEREAFAAKDAEIERLRAACDEWKRDYEKIDGAYLKAAADLVRLTADREEIARILDCDADAIVADVREVYRAWSDDRAALARVRGQRDRLAIDMKHSIHADRLFFGSSDAKRESAEIMESEYGLRIENGEVKEIKGS